MQCCRVNLLKGIEDLRSREPTSQHGGTDLVADYDQLIHGLKTPSGRVDLQLRCLCPFPRLARALCGSFNLCVTQKFEA